jgi:hypothetical protein
MLVVADARQKRMVLVTKQRAVPQLAHPLRFSVQPGPDGAFEDHVNKLIRDLFFFIR